MRKYLRKIARHNMKLAGMVQINRPERDSKGNAIGSKFKRNWRDFI